jgi:NAD(P)-dependent dehydrogenase (short-subunit alcohol dehydrogenase family)
MSSCREHPDLSEIKIGRLALAGRVVAVVGGSRGIGFAIAQAAAREGARTVVIARDRRRLRSAARRVEGAMAIAADVTRPADVRRAFGEIRQRLGKLDALVNSAGTFTFKPFEQTTLHNWQSNLDANLTSVFLTTRAALPLLVQSRGQVVNILSISSRRAFANCTAYTAAKFGALGFTRALAEELRAKGIRVTAVLPGVTNTRLVRAFGFRVDRRSLVQPEDVAEAVISALKAPTRTTIEEVVITPSRGSL